MSETGNEIVTNLAVRISPLQFQSTTPESRLYGYAFPSYPPVKEGAATPKVESNFGQYSMALKLQGGDLEKICV